MEGEFAVELPFFRSHLSNETEFTSCFRQCWATSARYCFHVVWNLFNPDFPKCLAPKSIEYFGR